jgi:hypothetical protein
MSELSITLASRSSESGATAFRVGGCGVRAAVARIGCVRAALVVVRPVAVCARVAAVGSEADQP